MDVLVIGCVGLVIFSVLVAFIIFWRRKWFVHNYQEKCVVVTGTDSGFGKALALSLDQIGIKVYAGCYSEEGMKSLQEEASDKLKTVKMDVTDEKSLMAARDFIEADLARHNLNLWGLVNNAGINVGLLFLTASLEDYKACMDVNFFGAIRTTELFLHLIKKSRGRIVNMLSILRRFSSTTEPYTCSKMAMSAYNDGLRRCMALYGVLVSGIEPGFFPTNITNYPILWKEMERSWVKLPENLKEEYGCNFLEAVREDMSAVLENPPFSSFNHLGMVSNAITHALFARYPYSHYICGIDAHVFYRLASYLPDCLMDFVLRFNFTKSKRVLQLNLKKMHQQS